MQHRSHHSQSGLNINRWRQDVADATRTRKPRNPDFNISSPRNLRSSRRVTRPGLGEITGNSQKLNTADQILNSADDKPTRKRKRNMSARPGGQQGRGGRRAQKDEDDDEFQEVNKEPPRRRGRPPKQPVQQQPGSSSTTSKVIVKDHSARPKGKALSTSRPRAKKTLNDPPSTVSIELRQLERSNPAVKQRMPPDVIEEYEEIPAQANELLRTLDDIPPALVPSSLKRSYEDDEATPRKRRKAPNSRQYMLEDEMPYPSSELKRLKKRVDRVLKRAGWNHRKKVHERQWGAVAHSLLEELAIWDTYDDILVLNT
ncbi:MAG: hypothetical protein Q9166_006581 [cf. Caloplaca sp. 2 TL-2023]